MSWPEGIAARYDPGEDVRPLLRAAAGGVLGVAAALALDGVLPLSGGPRWLWSALWGSAGRATAGPDLAVTGATCVAGILLGFVFAYGQLRRFLPRRPALAGLVYGLALWTLTWPTMLLRASRLVEPAGVPATAELLRLSAGIVLETLAGCAVFGAVLGLLNARHRL